MRLVSSRRWRWLRNHLSERRFRVLAVAALLIVAVLMAGPRLRSGAEALPLEPGSAGTGLDAAFAAAFGPNDYALRRIGEGQELTRFTPGLLVEAPFGPVLISEGRIISPHAASTGKLAIAYLERRPDGYRARRSFVPAIEGGSLGELDGWRLRAGGPYPVIELQADCASPKQLELRPEGPRPLPFEALGHSRAPMC